MVNICMRFTEMNQLPPPGTELIGQEPSTPQPTNIQSPPTQRVYADQKQTNQLSKDLTSKLSAGQFSAPSPSGVKKIYHVRAQKISLAELKTTMSELGFTQSSPDSVQSLMSGKFPVHVFDKDGISYTVVIGSVKGLKSEAGIGINRKELAPTGLGLDGGKYSKLELIDATKQSVDRVIRDPNIKRALLGLVDIASQGGKGKLPPEDSDYIGDFIGVISQDFGEILAPIILMDENDIAEFPAGNNPIVDVKLKSMNLSIKALTGSGTSFKTVSDLMDKYEASIQPETEKSEQFKILKQFHPSLGGKNTDKIIRATAAASTPEFNKICELLGVETLATYSELVDVVSDKTASMDYGQFLRTFYPAMIAGNWGKPVGLPADGMYYMDPSKSKKPGKEKAAGKNSYESKPGQGAADILTYVMGVSLLNYITRGKKSKDYSDMMTDIVKQQDAVIGHITINRDGSMVVTTRPFSELKFQFQYHAPSHIPGNNLPGFMYIPD